MESRNVSFLNEHFSSPIFLSASPITSTTCINDSGAYDQDELKRKILFILNNKFGIGAVILKTVYFPEEKNTQENFMATRVWAKGEDYFHVGHTPKEMFSVNELKYFLERNEIKKLSNKIIISLGIKSADINKWQELFNILFGNNSGDCYKIIEVNARHTLREINMMCLGDKEIDEYIVSPVSQAVWNVVFQWFNLLNKLGIDNGKKLLIKLPFRSDLLILCQFIHKIIAENNKFGNEYGIRGITLINTIKSPTEDITHKGQNLLLCEEKVKLQQMSGYSLKAIRNWAIRTIKRRFENIEISASGGLMSIDDIMEAKAFGANTFQLCSWVIKDGLKILQGLSDKIMGEDTEYKKRIERIKKIGASDTILKCRRVRWNKHLCCRCMQCLRTYYCDAFVNKYLLFYINKTVCLNGENNYIPSQFFPKINPAYCSGCGLCIQICPTGALFFNPVGILLVSASPRRLNLMKKLTDNFLSAPSMVDEENLLKELINKNLQPDQIAKEIALAKARKYTKCKEFKVLVSADTLIVFQNQIIGKPKDIDEAREVLSSFSNNTHTVITGLVLIDVERNREFLDYDSAKVTFKKLTPEQIDTYLKEENWKDKAGGYDYNEVKDSFINKITKNKENTIRGLPIEKLKELFIKAGLSYLL